MTPQERELITSLINRLKKVAGEPKDREAEALIRQSIAEQPDAPYQLVQTVLIQDMALNQAQSRIADLEKQLADATARTQPTSFLGGLAGRAGGAAPPFGPWGQPAQPPSNYTPANYEPANYGQGGYARPGYAPPPLGGVQAGSGGLGASGFLRSAATTAAGVAGGALLFEGIQSMFGRRADGILSGVPQQPAITETMINNYYGDDPGGQQDYGAQDVSDDMDFPPDDSFDDGEVI